MQSSRQAFYAFGLKVTSDWSLPCSNRVQPTFASLAFRREGASFFAARVPRALRSQDPTRIHYHDLEDGSRYLRWRGVFEFLISPDSKVISGHSLDGAPAAAFRTYMLGHLFSYALLGFGIETFHATSVVLNGQAIAFLGDSARGKSTLAAAFLANGAELLTDDFLVLGRHEKGYVAYPGLPRIKLYRSMSKHLLPARKGQRFTPGPVPKYLYPMEPVAEPKPLRAFYSLVSPEAIRGQADVRIEPLAPRQAYLEITENTFNVRVQTRERLASQFRWATEVVTRVPVKRLSYPRTLKVLPEVIAAVRADLQIQR